MFGLNGRFVKSLLGGILSVLLTFVIGFEMLPPHLASAQTDKLGPSVLPGFGDGQLFPGVDDPVSQAFKIGSHFIDGPVSQPVDPVAPQKSKVTVSADKAGQIVSTSGKITLDLPQGSVSSPVSVELAEYVLWGSTGAVFLNVIDLNASVESSGAKVTQFAKNLQITFKHTPQELQGLDVNSLHLYYLDENTKAWTPVASTFDPKTLTLTATITHFSHYGEMANPLVDGPGRVMSAYVGLQSGAGIYNYPITMPPGPGGFQPNVELVYNSASVDEIKNKRDVGSWVGVGWSLGLGRITKDVVSNTYYLDFSQGSYQLISIDNTNYYTQPQVFLKITRSGDTWEVLDTSGTYYKFGGTPTSIQYLTAADGGSYRWDLSLIRDTNGNEAGVTYVQDIKGTSPNQWVRSAYPEYLTYGNIEVHFISSADQNDPTDGLIRNDDPKTYGSNPAPKVMENKKLTSIEIKAGGTLVYKYNFVYTTTNSTYSSDYGGIYYAGKFTLYSITQRDSADQQSLPAMTFAYTDLQIYRHTLEGDYVGNPGNAATLSLPRLTQINSGYGGNIAFTYGQTPTGSPNDIWTRQVVTVKTINSGVGSSQVYNYVYSSGPSYFGTGWSAPFRGFSAVTEYIDSDKRIDHSYDTTYWLFSQGDESTERLSGKETSTSWYTAYGILNNTIIKTVTNTWVSGASEEITLQSVGTLENTISSLNAPRAIAVAPDGYVFVADTGANLIRKYRPDGSLETSFGTSLNQPKGIAVSRDGYVFVANTGANQIQKYTTSGTYLGSFGSSLNGPQGMCIGPSGFLWVANTGANSVQQYSLAGVLQTTVSVWYDGGQQYSFNAPRGVAENPLSGAIYVADTGNNVVHIYSPGSWGNMANLRYYKVNGVDTAFNQPQGISFSPVDAALYIVDSGQNLVHKYKPNAAFLWAPDWEANFGSSLNGPQAVSVGPDNRIFVTNTGANTLQKYAPSLLTWKTKLNETLTNELGTQSKVRYEYDSYNNVTRVWYDGDLATSNDNYSVAYEYFANTSANILNKMASSKTYDKDSNLTGETLNYYDSASSYTTAPVKGNLTKTESYKDATNFVINQFTYDNWGNMLTSQDGEGNTTTWTYEATHIYPDSKTLAITSQVEHYTYDPGTPNLATLVDVNSQTTTYQYDTFKRLRKVFKPGDTSTPSIEYIYNSWGTINQQNIETRTTTTGANYLWQKQFFDGLGRVIQTQSSGETISGTTYVIVSGTITFNNMGSVDKAYVDQKINATQINGYKAPDSTWKYTQYVYDVYGRQTHQANADGTNIFTNYSMPWKSTVINERGYATDYSYDAFGRLVKVEQYDKTGSGATFNTKWGTYGTAPGQFNYADFLASDSQGNIYVVDRGNNRIQKFDSSGIFIRQWGSAGSGAGQFNTAYGIACDSSNNVYVVDAGNSRIQKFDSNGNYLGQFGTYGSGAGQFNFPVDVAVDSSGNIYVTDRNNYRVQKFNSSFSYLTAWGSPGSGVGQFNGIIGIGIDSSNNVYVADNYNYRVQKFNSTGSSLGQFGSQGSGNGQFTSCADISIDAAGGIFVTDLTRVEKFNSSFAFQYAFGTSGSGDGQFQSTLSVAVTSKGIYVSDEPQNRIQFFTEGANSLYATTTYSYDSRSNLIQVKDNSNNTTTINYNWLGWKTSMTDPDMGNWSYTYYNTGSLLTQTDAKSQVITFIYDDLNRLTNKSYTAGLGMTDVVYSYDDTTSGNLGKGFRTGMTDAAGTVTYKYDNRGRLIEEKRTVDSVIYTTQYAYDIADRISTITYPTNEVVTETYDGRGSPYTLTGNTAGTLVTSAFYNQFGQFTEIDYNNTLKTTYGYYLSGVGYDTSGGFYGKLWEIKTLPQAGGTALQDLRYTWDAGGNMSTRQDVVASQTETFSYDFLDRITGVSGAYSNSYAYNTLGNITSMNGTSYTYGTQPHAVTQVGTTTYTYDSNGNMSSKGTGQTYIDINHNGTYDAGTDTLLGLFGDPGDTTLAIDWNGDGSQELATFSSGGTWKIDTNRNGAYNAGIDWTNSPNTFGNAIGDIPLAIDWDGNGTQELAFFRPSTGVFTIDINHNGQYDAGTDIVRGPFFTPQAGDIPMVVDWDGNGTQELALFRSGGTWFIDLDHDGVFGSGTVGTLTLTNGGSGFTSTPTVGFTGGGGSGAAASASLTATTLNTFNITGGGSGYTTAPGVTVTGGGGSGAAGTSVLTPTTLNSLTLTNNGSGFTSSPAVSFTGGGGSGAVGTISLTATTVNTITVTNGGSGYGTPPTVTITGGGGSGATATATLSGTSVASITVTNPGSGYTSTPTVTITGSGSSSMAASFNGTSSYVTVASSSALKVGESSGTSASYEFWVKTTATTETVFMDKGSIVPYIDGGWLYVDFYYRGGTSWYGAANIQINDGNWHYIVATHNGSISKIYVDGTLKASHSSSNRLLSTGTQALNIGRSSGGTYFVSGPMDEIRISSSARTQTEITNAWNSGNGNAFTADGSTVALYHCDDQASSLTDATSNHFNGTLYNITYATGFPFSGGGGSGATATANLTATTVAGITLSNGGSGFTSVPTVNITGGGGSGAAATATLTGTSVASITKTSGGSGYTSSPTVTIAPPSSGTTATATASLTPTSVASLNLTNHGSGYSSAPTVSITGGGGSGATATATLSAADLQLGPFGDQAGDVPIVIEWAGSAGQEIAFFRAGTWYIDTNKNGVYNVGIDAALGPFGNQAGDKPLAINWNGGTQAELAFIRPPQTMTFDVENRVTSVVGNGSNAQFLYDGDGNRIKKTENGETILYVNRYYEKNITTAVVTTYYFLGGQEIAERAGSTLRYFHQDSLNSTSLVTSSTGTSLGSSSYLPFGSVRTGSVPTDEKFTGQRLDSTGLYYYNARYYDPTIGRFVSPDSIGQNLVDPQTLNRYSYVLNNPLKYNDPTGHTPWGAIIGAISYVAVKAVINATKHIHEGPLSIISHSFDGWNTGEFIQSVCIGAITDGLSGLTAVKTIAQTIEDIGLVSAKVSVPVMQGTAASGLQYSADVVGGKTPLTPDAAITYLATGAVLGRVDALVPGNIDRGLQIAAAALSSTVGGVILDPSSPIAPTDIQWTENSDPNYRTMKGGMLWT